MVRKDRPRSLQSGRDIPMAVAGIPQDIIYVEPTTDEEGALGELPTFEIFVEDEEPHNNTMMDDAQPADSIANARDSALKGLPHTKTDMAEPKKEEEVGASSIGIDENTAGAQQKDVPLSEQTAENGYFIILAKPKISYDQEADPAGLYGGREVDDRPSLYEFYEQDARTNNFFAKMAPTKAEREAEAAESEVLKAKSETESELLNAKLVAEAAANTELLRQKLKAEIAAKLELIKAKNEIEKLAVSKPRYQKAALKLKLAEADLEAEKPEVPKLRPVHIIDGGPLTRKKGILNLRPPKGDYAPAKRSYTDVLIDASPTTAPANAEANYFRGRLSSKVSFSPDTKGESSQAKVTKTVARGRMANETRSNHADSCGYGEFVDISVNEYYAPESNDSSQAPRLDHVRSWKREPNKKGKWYLKVTNPDVSEDGYESDTSTRGSTPESNEDTDLEKAIAASLEQFEKEEMERINPELKENVTPGVQQASNDPKACETKANTDHLSSYKAIDRAATALDRSKEEEDAELDYATWQASKEGSPERKRKCTSQSVPENGANEGLEERIANRGWTRVEGSGTRSHKRSKSFPCGDRSS